MKRDAATAHFGDGDVDDTSSLNDIKIISSPQEILNGAMEQKEAGNDSFKAGNMREAKKHYHYCILAAKGLISSPGFTSMAQCAGSATTSEEQERMSASAKELLATVYNNLAQCVINTIKEGNERQDYNRALQYCNQSLEYKPNNVKAMYRKALTQFSLEEYFKAIDTCQEAMAIGNTPALQKLKRDCQAKLDDKDRKSRSEMLGMFDRQRNAQPVQQHDVNNDPAVAVVANPNNLCNGHVPSTSNGGCPGDGDPMDV